MSRSKGYNLKAIVEEMPSETKQGKKAARTEKKRPPELAGGRPEDATKGKRKPVEGEISGRVEKKPQVAINVVGKKELKVDIVLTPVQLRNKHGCPQFTLDNISGSHSRL